MDGRRIVDDTIRGLVNAGMIKEEDRNDIVDTWVFHAKYSYPTPSVERDAILSQAIPFLEKHDIYSRGRFGMWKYEVSNTDHSLMQGVELVNKWFLNETESTIGIKYESTQDGRNAAVHERSALAGSGDPKRTAKTSPDADATAVSHPGRKSTTRFATSSSIGGPGDKLEVHTSEEELGVTTPLEQEEEK